MQDYIVNSLVTECNIDKEFALNLFTHYKHRDNLMTNEEATVRIFGIQTDSNVHSRNRQEINQYIEKHLDGDDGVSS